MLKLVDRYLLRELSLPLALALVGFLIFFMLLIIGQLSQFLVDRLIPPGTLALLMLYRVPYLFTLALPVAILFAIFLALGRLGHDREIVALQAGGVSLRRLMVPLLIVGALLSGVDFWIGDRLAPWSNRQFYGLFYRSYLGSQSAPQIRDNAFFKGPDERFFYVRHYDKSANVLRDVLIYDLTGQLALADSGKLPKVITAGRARWEDTVWRLFEGVVHVFDEAGNLRYKSKFETLDINVGKAIRQLAFEQRTPQEMSLLELAERIEAFRQVGRPAEALLVEYHAKIAIPLACFVFALFGAPLSLLIGPRGRALGVILSVLLVLLYQGVYFWTAKIMASRGDLPPAWGAWLPNLIFGLVGLVLTLKADQFGRLDVLDRARRWFPLALVAGSLWAVAWPAAAQPGDERFPIEVSADALTVMNEWQQMVARGHVHARYREGTIAAEHLQLNRQGESRWEISAERATFNVGELSGGALEMNTVWVQEDERLIPDRIELAQSASVEFSGGRLSARRLSLVRAQATAWSVEAQGDVVLQHNQENQITRAEALTMDLEADPDSPERWRVKTANALKFTGATAFVNARGETHRLRFEGEDAQISFSGENEVSVIDVQSGNFTTCTCEAEIPDASYSIRAGRLLIRPEEVLAALDITVRAFGQPIFWAPAYLSPLGDIQQKYPFLPEIGRDAGRGWFAKWRIPVYAGEEALGHVLIDYYTRYGEVGTGLDLTYRLLPGSAGGRLSFYRLTGRGESIALDWAEHLELEDETELDLSAGLRTGRLAREATRLLTGGTLSGSASGWTWRVAFNRDQNILGEDPDPEQLEDLPYLVLERMPEVSLTSRMVALSALPLQFSSGLEWGRYREVALDGTDRASSRFDGRLQARLASLVPTPGMRLEASSGYRLTLYESERRDAWDLRSQLRLSPLSSLSVTLGHLYRFVQGQSPFRFDRLSLSHHATLQGSWGFSAWGSVRLSTGYDWTLPGFAPLKISLDARWGMAQGALGLDMELNTQALRQATFQGGLKGEGWRLSLSGGYDFSNARLDDVIAKLDLGARLRTGLRFNPNALALRRVNVQTDWILGEWELQLGGEYDLQLERFTALQFGVIKRFCHACWQIGLYGDGTQLSVQAQINAFPTAKIGYSPTDQTLSFGE